MERHQAHAVPLLGMISLILLAACGTSSNSPSSSSSAGGGGGGGLSACSGSVTIASDLPVSGSDASDGVPTANGVKLAVTQANSSHLLGGCTVQYVPKDDSSVALGKHDPNQGNQNMISLVGNPAVVGVIGPFNSNVAQAEMATANNGDLVMISPSNTNPGLTIVGSNPDINTASLRPTGKITYFRVCTTDIGQGKGLATVALQKLNAKKAYVFDDQETYGKGLADQFSKFFTSGGGTVVKRVGLPGTTTDFSAQLTEAKNDGSDLLFFGGTSSNGGGIIRKQEAQNGMTLPFIGGDGIVDSEFFTEAGPAGDGAYGTIAAPDPTKLDTAAKFVADYKAAFNQDPGAYSANAYDATNILLQAIKKVLTANGGAIPSSSTFREKVRTAMFQTSYDGAIGHTAFDRNGDTTNALLTLEVGQNQAWVFSETIKQTLS